MPHIDLPAYRPPRIFFNGHLQTVYPALFRKPIVSYERERLETPDGDFLDIDWAKTGSDKLLILLHGLEGNSDAQYIKGMINAMHKRGWDAVVMNFRSCSGEPNRLLRSYHSGETEDIDFLIRHLAQHHAYEQMALTGFSLGGNVTLKYLGEQGTAAQSYLSGAVAISVPCDLETSSRQLASPANYFYFQRFLRRLNRKVISKRHLMDNPPQEVLKMKNFHEFDNAFTAPIHGFSSAKDYYTRSSSGPFIPGIRIPTLLINAWNDPFLSPACFPVNAAKANPNFTLLTSKQGGHVGFPLWQASGEYWHEGEGADFLGRQVPTHTGKQ